jgi:hypothetical protein
VTSILVFNEHRELVESYFTSCSRFKGNYSTLRATLLSKLGNGVMYFDFMPKIDGWLEIAIEEEAR